MADYHQSPVPVAAPELDEHLLAYSSSLDVPVIGMEAEFTVYIDGKEIVPEEVWRSPSGFIRKPVLKRTTKSSQLPTGGAVYFDKGVIEVVTPVIEVAPLCTARMVRNLWEQIGFVRDELTSWERETGSTVRLQAFSSHFNISFELTRDERSKDRTIQKLVLLLAHILPVSVIVAGTNPTSTGIGVRPRRKRVEITLDFTPDPALMLATAAVIVGIVREVISWPSYRLSVLDTIDVPVLADVTPGKHTTRKGWLTKDRHFPRNPFTSDLDERVWQTVHHGDLSLRTIALKIVTYFKTAIERYADPFSVRILLSVLEGRTPSLLDLPERAGAYDDVGRLSRWGSVIEELENFKSELQLTEVENEALTPLRRSQDVETRLQAPWSSASADRRRAGAPERTARNGSDRRQRTPVATTEEGRLTRSPYEQVFLKLVSGKRLELAGELLTPIEMKGWYHAKFRREADGSEVMLSIDQLRQHANDWK